MAASAVLSGCGPFVNVVRLADVPPNQRAAAARVQVVPLGAPVPAGAKVLQPVEAHSCKSWMTDPPATTGNAIQQLQVRTVRAGGNAVVNVTTDTRGADTWGTNCWQTVTASGMAAIVPDAP